MLELIIIIKAANYLDGPGDDDHAENVDHLGSQQTEVIQTFEISAGTSAGSNVILMNENAVNAPRISIATGLQDDDENDLNKTIETLKKENMDANHYISELQGQMNTLHHQVLVLENNNSTGKENSRFH